MNLWLLACLVACFVGHWAPAVHAQGGFEDCCLGYQTNIGRRNLLLRATSFRRQEVSGSCNLPAVIFHFRQKDRMVCADPWDKMVQRAMKLLASRMKPGHGTQKISEGFLMGKKKLNTGKFQSKDPSSRSKRNSSLSYSGVVMTSKGIHNPELLRTASGMYNVVGNLPPILLTDQLYIGALAAISMGSIICWIHLLDQVPG